MKPRIAASWWLKTVIATDDRRTRVLFIGMGNICRSPTAEAVFRDIDMSGRRERGQLLLDYAPQCALRRGA